MHPIKIEVIETQLTFPLGGGWYRINTGRCAVLVNRNRPGKSKILVLMPSIRLRYEDMHRLASWPN